jgi:hypothetical protein
MSDMFGTTGTPNQGNSSNVFFGNRFTVSASFTASYWQWYRSTSGDGMISYFLLWNVTDNTKLLQDSPADPGGTGWLEAAMSAPVTLVTGKTYQIDIGIQGGNTCWGWTTAPPSINTPFTVTSIRYGGSTGAYSDSVSGFELLGAQVADGPLSGGGGGTGTLTSDDLAAIADELAKWLSSSAPPDTHTTDGLPWLTKTVADAIKVVTDKLGHSGSGNSLDWIVALWRLAGDLTDAEIGLLKSLLDRQGQVLGASGGGGSAFYGPSGTQVAEGVETLLARTVDPTGLGAAVALLREQLTLSPDLADTSRWTLVDTVTGEGDALVELQADLYRVSIGDAPGTHGPQLVAGAEWRPRWGWAAPRIHGCYLQRQPLVDLSPIAIAPGLFMDGVLLYTHPGFTWTVEAFVLDRA